MKKTPVFALLIVFLPIALVGQVNRTETISETPLSEQTLTDIVTEEPAKVINEEAASFSSDPEPAKVINEKAASFSSDPEPAKVINEKAASFSSDPEPTQSITVLENETLTPVEVENETIPGLSGDLQAIEEEPGEVVSTPAEIENNEPMPLQHEEINADPAVTLIKVGPTWQPTSEQTPTFEPEVSDQSVASPVNNPIEASNISIPKEEPTSAVTPVNNPIEASIISIPKEEPTMVEELSPKPEISPITAQFPESIPQEPAAPFWENLPNWAWIAGGVVAVGLLMSLNSGSDDSSSGSGKKSASNEDLGNEDGGTVSFTW